MNLDDAIRQGQLLVTQLKGRDAVAVHSLLELAKKVRSARGAVRQLADAIAPESGLNQTRLFDE